MLIELSIPVNHVEFYKGDHIENWVFTKDSLDLDVDQIGRLYTGMYGETHYCSPGSDFYRHYLKY